MDEKVAQEMGRATEVPLLLFDSEEEVFHWLAALFLACCGEASALHPAISRVVFVFIVCWGLILRSIGEDVNVAITVSLHSGDELGQDVLHIAVFFCVHQMAFLAEEDLLVVADMDVWDAHSLGGPLHVAEDALLAHELGWAELS